MAVVINKPKIYDGNDKDIEAWAYRLLIERIDKFLEKNNNKTISANTPPQYGIMIVDSCSNNEDNNRLRNKIAYILRNGTYYCKPKYLIEDPLFTDSKWRNMSQLADCVAYAVRKNFRYPEQPSFHDKNWLKYYTMLLKKVDRDENGKIEGCGIKTFP